MSPRRPDVPTFPIVLGREIRRARERAGLSQLALAGRLGVTQNLVSKWERGENQPNALRLVALVTLLGVNLDAAGALAVAS